jgi:squalene-hopene/tetraprenyl-beta-curcumene cyclase
MRTSKPVLLLCVALIAGCGGKDEPRKEAGPGPGAPPPASPGPGADAKKRVDEATAKARALLLQIQQPDGSFGDPPTKRPPSIGYTAMAVTALVAATPAAQVSSDPAVRKALEYLAKNQKADGSIYLDANPAFINYETSAAVGAFAAAKVHDFRDAMVKARDYLASSQYAGEESDVKHGGFPYASKRPQPPDLSNLQFAAEALALAELPKDHVVWKRMLVYLDRAQNRSESNALRVEVEDAGQKVTVVAGNDGGAGYGPGMSKAGLVKRSDGTYETKSYGSMTYALLKCFLLAGAPPDDPRVLAALGWLTRSFTVDRNPGFEGAQDPAKASMQGYYYYVFTMARALALYESLTKKPLEVKDADGRKHDWRAELAEKLVSLQGADGGWTNPVAERWDEDARTLVTSYALQALGHASGRLP